MKYWLAAIILLGWLLTTYLVQASHIDPVTQTLGTTDEGYWVIVTTDQHFVARMCGNANDPRIIGCAVWSGPNTEVLPAKECLISIWEYPGATQEELDGTFSHEYKHCRIGAYHDEKGVDIPGYEPKPDITIEIPKYLPPRGN